MHTWHASGKYWRRSRRGKSRARVPAFTRMPVYARIAIPILLILLIGRLAWQSMHSIRGSSHSAAHSEATLAPAAAPVAPWERDFADSLDETNQDIQQGNITAAEFAVDRAESILTAARLQNLDAQPAFFASALAALDRVIERRPEDDRLFDHVTQARVSLAELRSSGAPDSVNAVDFAAGSHPVRIAEPREMAANETLAPRSLGGDYLDATLMPDTAEILLPPSSRSPGDNVRVENIIIAGAAQTLDGIHWHDVTFIGTHLRYESGDLDLDNVRFVRCRFGIPSNDRGARLASALALGQSSITISQSQQP